VTSVSRSDHDDEAPEGTGTGVSADGAASAAPRAPRRSPAVSKSSAAKTTGATSTGGTSTGGKTPAAKPTTAKTTNAKTTAAKPAASKAAPKPAAGDEAQQPAPSKRTAASRAASTKAAAARGEAAKTARSARTSATSTPAERSRAAAAASTKRQTQRVAAALTTETTTAERATRKPDEATAATAAGATPAAVSEVEETTRERPVARPERTAAALAAAAKVADHAVTGPAETAEGEASRPAPALEPAPEASDTDQAVVVIRAPRKPAPRKNRTLRVARPAPGPNAPRVLAINGLVKRFGDNTAVGGISLDVRAGSFYGIVGPNGAGKTTTLSMVTGLLRPDAGTVRINDIDAWANPRAAKRVTGALPDRLRLFDRLTGAQLLYYAGVLRGLDDRTVRERSAELIAAFGLEDAVDRLVADYSAGMTKKVALACAMIHAPRLLVLDEPFESVDPVSAANLTDILERYVEGGGTVLLSSHGMDLIERVCDSAAIIIGGRVLAAGTLDEVRAGHTLEDRFVELAGGRKAAEGMEWLHSFSD
jgi:ABC-type multidrug transport system ATPase subunit